MSGNATILEGAWFNQNSKRDAASAAAGQSPATTPPLLIDKHELGKLLGIGQRKLHEVLSQDWMPPGIELGPKCIRWNREEVAAALSQRAPRRAARSEPTELQQARAQRKAAA